MSIQIRNLHKRFGATVVCDQLKLDIHDGELVALLGPSGSGKTSLLRIIAGLEVADSGTVLFDGQDTSHIDVRERQVGFVFQHFALFGQMTVFENIAFGLRVRPSRAKPGSGLAARPGEPAIKARVTELLELVQLDGLAGRYPHQLSGGQRQRVALARALAVKPKLLLLDEPFGALDAQVRKDLRRWLRRLHDEMQVTSVFVTHDQDEAMEVADRIVLMNQGRIEQVGRPDEVYDHPATPFVQQFLGAVNRLPQLPGHRVVAGPGAGNAPSDDLLYVRPHELDMLAEGGIDGDGTWGAVLTQALALGPLTRLEFKRDDGSQVDVELPRAHWQLLQQRLQLAPGGRAWLKPRRITRFAAAA